MVMQRQRGRMLGKLRKKFGKLLYSAVLKRKLLSSPFIKYLRENFLPVLTKNPYVSWKFLHFVKKFSDKWPFFGLKSNLTVSIKNHEYGPVSSLVAVSQYAALNYCTLMHKFVHGPSWAVLVSTVSCVIPTPPHPEVHSEKMYYQRPMLIFLSS